MADSQDGASKMMRWLDTGPKIIQGIYYTMLLCGALVAGISGTVGLLHSMKNQQLLEVQARKESVRDVQDQINANGKVIRFIRGRQDNVIKVVNRLDSNVRAVCRKLNVPFQEPPEPAIPPDGTP